MPFFFIMTLMELQCDIVRFVFQRMFLIIESKQLIICGTNKDMLKLLSSIYLQ